jgi:hypothetical protein
MLPFDVFTSFSELAGVGGGKDRGQVLVVQTRISQ